MSSSEMTASSATCKAGGGGKTVFFGVLRLVQHEPSFSFCCAPTPSLLVATRRVGIEQWFKSNKQNNFGMSSILTKHLKQRFAICSTLLKVFCDLFKFFETSVDLFDQTTRPSGPNFCSQKPRPPTSWSGIGCSRKEQLGLKALALFL